MAVNLWSANAKVARAEEHIRCLHDELTAWGDSDPYEGVRDVNANHTRWAVRLRERKSSKVHLERAAILAGDALHNLRSSLDHMAYAVAAHEHHGTTPLDVGHQFSFVVADNNAGYRNAARRKKLKRVLSPAALVAFEAVQPYNRRYGPSGQLGLLAVLRDFNNTDKHRMLTSIFAARGKATIDILKNPDGAQFVYPSNLPDRLEDGTEIMRFTSDVPAPNMKYEFVLEVGVSAEHRGTPVHILTALDEIVAEIRQVFDIISAAV